MVYRTALVSVTFNNPKPSFQGHAKYDITVYCKYRTSLTMQPLRYDIIINMAKSICANCELFYSDKGFDSIMSGMFLWSL